MQKREMLPVGIHQGPRRRSKTEKQRNEKIEFIQDELQCSVCLDEFEKPKILWCMHTFCEKCLVGINRCTDEKQIRCPICREITELQNGISSLPPNYIAQNIIEKMKNREKVLICHDCVEKAPASKHCSDCNLNLCGRCVEYHKRSVRFAGHTLVQLSRDVGEKIGETSRYCNTHKELLKYFCKDCKILVCNDCMVSKIHQGHDIGLVKEVREKIVEEVKNMIADGKIVLQEFEWQIHASIEFQKQADEAKFKSILTINAVFDDLQKSLDEKRSELFQAVERKYHQNESFYRAKQKRNQLHKIVEYSESVCNSQFGFDAVDKLEQLKNQLIVFYNEIDANSVIDVVQQRQQIMQEEKHKNNHQDCGMVQLNNLKLEQRQCSGKNPAQPSGTNDISSGDNILAHGYRPSPIIFHWKENAFERSIGNIEIKINKVEILEEDNAKQEVKTYLKSLNYTA